MILAVNLCIWLLLFIASYIITVRMHMYAITMCVMYSMHIVAVQLIRQLLS